MRKQSRAVETHDSDSSPYDSNNEKQDEVEIDEIGNTGHYRPSTITGR